MSNKKEGYIICGNFETHQDELTGTFHNVSTRMKMAEFYCAMRAFAEARGLDLVSYLSDAVVMSGDRDDFERLTKTTSNCFSYAHIDEVGMKKALAVEAQFSPRKMVGQQPGFFLT